MVILSSDCGGAGLNDLLYNFLEGFTWAVFVFDLAAIGEARFLQ